MPLQLFVCAQNSANEIRIQPDSFARRTETQYGCVRMCTDVHLRTSDPERLRGAVDGTAMPEADVGKRGSCSMEAIDVAPSVYIITTAIYSQ